MKSILGEDRTFPAQSVDVFAVKGVPRDPAVRLYGTSVHGPTWSLQVRGPHRLANGREGKDFMVASASLGLHEMAGLRNQITHSLEEYAEATSTIATPPEEREPEPGPDVDEVTVTLHVRGMGLFGASAAIGEHTFVTGSFDTKVGARIAALGLVQAHLAAEVEKGRVR